MKYSWVIYQFMKDGDNPHIFVVGIVDNVQDMKSALKRFKGSWAIKYHRLSWKE